MSTFKVSDNAATRLATSISSSSYVTSLVLTDASKFPVINNGGTGTEYSYITLYDSANNFESVKVTRRDSGSNTLTIVRGTAAGIQGITDDSCIAWSSGTTGVACRPIAQTINDVVQSAASAASSASAASTSAGNAASSASAASTSAAAAAASFSSVAAASMTLTNKGVNLTSNTLSGTKAQFNTACSDGDFIFTSDFPWSSNGSPGVTKIAPDGQMEVSRYIDFHPAGGDASDYTVRLDGGPTGSTTLNLVGSFVAWGDVSAKGNMGCANFYATGNVSAYSDARLKTDLVRIDDALYRVSGLAGYTFTRTDSGERQTGLLAQDVQKVLPEAVSEAENGTLSLAYGNLAGLLVEAIKELAVEVAAIKAKLA